MPYADLEKRKVYHREYMREYNKTHKLSDEQKVKKSVYMKIYADKNTEQLSDYQRKRYLRDGEKMRLRTKRYLEENRALIKGQRANSYLRNREARLIKVKEYAKTHKEQIKLSNKLWRQSPKGRLQTYIKSAEIRGYEFGLNADDFTKLLVSDCHYCGKKQANGVDRKENNIGYILGNVVACCTTCNYMKRGLSYDNFKKHIRRIYNNMG